MQVLVIFSVVLAVAAGHVIQDAAAEGRSLSSQVVDFLEASKEQMPCGFPGVGVPPLAPVKAEHREVHLQGENFQLDGIVDKFRLNNFETFNIDEFKINAILSKVTWKFTWANMNVNTKYDMEYATKQKGLMVKMHRKGNALINLENLIIWGTARYSLGVLTGGGLRLKEFKLYMSLGKVKSEIDGLHENKIMNRLVNEIIEEIIMISINENTENMAVLSNKYVVPIANNMIGDLTIGDIIGGIGGGGSGGENGEPIEKEACIPPEISRDDNGVWSFSFV